MLVLFYGYVSVTFLKLSLPFISRFRAQKPLDSRARAAMIHPSGRFSRPDEPRNRARTNEYEDRTMNTNSNTNTNATEALQDLDRRCLPIDGSTESVIDALIKQCDLAHMPVHIAIPGRELDPAAEQLAIVPVQQRDPARGTRTIAVGIALIPTASAMLAEAAEWCSEIITDRLVATIANALRPRKGEAFTAPSSLPVSVRDFVTPSRDSGLAWYRVCAKTYVDIVNNLAGRRIVTAGTLRQILASAEYAAATPLRSVDQQSWEILLDKMIADAHAAGKDPGIVQVWRDTRNTATAAVIDFGADAMSHALGLDDDADDDA